VAYRHSRYYFPKKASDLHASLFAEIELESMEQTENETSNVGSAGNEDQQDNGKPFDESDTPEG
jgi:hypothetical protein